MFSASRLFLHHRPLLLGSVFAAAACVVLVRPAAAEPLDFIARSQQCVAQLKRLDPGTPIRSGLKANSCLLEKEAVAFTDPPPRPWLASGAACTGSLGATPAAETPRCGQTTELADTISTAVVRIDLGGGRCLHVMPIMLTDKTDGFSCNAVKARTACVIKVRKDGGKTIVTLAAGRAASSPRADVVVAADPDRHEPLVAQSRQGPLFVLMPGEFTFKGAAVDAQGYVARQMEAYADRCEGDARHCHEQVHYVADLHLQQVLRRVWNPRSLLSADERRAEREAFLKAIDAQRLGAHEADMKRFARIITKNEISSESPYQVLDAVIRNSGLSWGAHQIDIGANPQGEIDLFWKTLRDWRRAPGTGNYPNLRRADQYRVCLSQPLRSFYVSQLALMWQALPDMNKGFRAAASQEAYRRHFTGWLKTEVTPVTKFDGLFRVSPFARLYYLDQLNQRGTKAGRVLKTVGQSFEADDLRDCSAVAAAEAKLVEAIKCAYLAGNCNAPPSDLLDIERRVENLRDMLKSELGAGQGRSCT